MSQPVMIRVGALASMSLLLVASLILPGSVAAILLATAFLVCSAATILVAATPEHRLARVHVPVRGGRRHRR